MSTKTAAMLLSLAILIGAPQLSGEQKEAVYANKDHTLKVFLERTDVLIKSETDALPYPGLLEFTGKMILPYGRRPLGGKEKDETRPAAISTDDGKSWRDLPSDSPFRDFFESAGLYSYMRDGSILYIDCLPLEAKRKPEEWGPYGYHGSQRIKNPTFRVRRFSKNGELAETFTTRLVGLPWNEASYELYGDILELKNGDLLTAFQCHVQKPTDKEGYAFTVFVARSTDGGRTFKHVWTFDPIADGKKMGEQGYDEPDMAVLPNGDILCIMRTGSYTPMYQSRSKDGGKTWSQPLSTGWPGVKPRLRVLRNGVLVCSTGRGMYGRPQVTDVMFSIDGTGEVWEPPFIFYNGPGWSYTWNLEREGKLYVVYEASAPDKPPSAYGLPFNSIRWAVLKVIKERRK